MVNGPIVSSGTVHACLYFSFLFFREVSMQNQSINTVDNNNNVGFIIICEKKMTTGTLSTSDTNMSELFSNQK